MQLSENEVDVWCADLNTLEDQLQNYRMLLNEVELTKANRFRFPIHSKQYILSHGLLRTVLSKYLNEEPAKIDIQVADNRKPYLPNSSLEFNLSHSGARAIIALGHQPVGIDIEIVKVDYPAEIPPRYFHADENIELEKSAIKSNLFYDIWSRKEAMLKALGNTFSIKSHLFSTLNSHLDLFDQHWQIIPLAIYHDYASTLVTTSNNVKVNIWEFKSDSIQLLKTQNLVLY